MQQIGCTSCHVQNLEVRNDRRVADAETTLRSRARHLQRPFRGRLPAVPASRTATAIRSCSRIGGKFVVENVFTDLKRHDLGPAFHERDFDGTRITSHVTEPLWGVGTTAPYGHDGRSMNLDAVIRRHGGEAEGVTRAYVGLAPTTRRRSSTSCRRSCCSRPTTPRRT